MKGEVASWIITAQDRPKEWYFRWGGHYIVLEEQDSTELDRIRKDSNRRRAVAEKRDKQNVQHSDEGSGKHDKPIPSASIARADPLTSADPWAKWGKVAGTATPVMDLTKDPQLAAITSRIEKLESGQDKVEQRLTGMEGQITTMGGTMESKFSEVLKAVAALAESQTEEAAKRRRGDHS